VKIFKIGLFSKQVVHQRKQGIEKHLDKKQQGDKQPYLLAYQSDVRKEPSSCNQTFPECRLFSRSESLWSISFVGQKSGQLGVNRDLLFMKSG
jgi:hypothetical protein